MHTSPEPRGTPHVDRQTPVKTLPYPKLRLRVVIMQNKTIDGTITSLITARKRSLRRLCFHRCVSVHRGGLPQCMLGYHPPCQGDLPRSPLPRRPPSKETPLPRIPPRSTPKGEIEGDQIQAHTQGGNWWDQIQAHTQGGNSGGSGPAPTPNNCCRWYASYWNAFLLRNIHQIAQLPIPTTSIPTQVQL